MIWQKVSSENENIEEEDDYMQIQDDDKKSPFDQILKEANNS